MNVYALRRIIISKTVKSNTAFQSKWTLQTTNVRHFTHTRNSRRKSWDMATTLPMKNPTAKLLWNLRIIMVPPILRNISMIPDHIAAKPSEMLLVDVTHKLMTNNNPDKTKMEYLIRIQRKRWVHGEACQCDPSDTYNNAPPTGNQFSGRAATKAIRQICRVLCQSTHCIFSF